LRFVPTDEASTLDHEMSGEEQLEALGYL